MYFITFDKLPDMLTKFVVWVGRNMMELVDRNQAVIKRLHAEFVDRKSEGCMGANQSFVV